MNQVVGNRAVETVPGTAIAVGPKADFMRAQKEVGAPSLREAASDFGHERLFISKALQLAGADRRAAHYYDEREVRKLFPPAKALVFEQACENMLGYAKLKQGERAVIITERGKMETAETLKSACARATGGANVLLIDLDAGEYGARPFLEKNERLQHRIAEFGPSVSFYIASCLPGEEGFRIPLIYWLEGAKRAEGEEPSPLKCRHLHSPGLTERMMAEGMLTSQKEVRIVTDNLMRLMKNAVKVEVTSPAGTNMVFTFAKDGSRKWVRDDDVEAGDFINLPCGEVFTTPEDANGTLVIDGVLGAHFDAKYGPLDGMHVVMKIKHGYCKGLEVVFKDPSLKERAKELEAEVKGYIKKAEFADRVGELGIGTNVGLKELIGVLLQDEKNPSVHVALGDPIGEKTGADWEGTTHMDGVMKNCTVRVHLDVGGMVIVMKDGEFTSPIVWNQKHLPD